MNLEKSKIIFRVIIIGLLVFLVISLGLFIYLMIKRPDIIPKSETYESFWIKNFSLVIAALAFAASAIYSAYNALEQRHLRFIESYPYLEVFPILTVDALPLPVPTAELPEELRSFNTDYLTAVAPSQKHQPSSIELRYCGIVLINVGHGIITEISIEGTAEVPNKGGTPSKFKIDRRINLPSGKNVAFSILPIAGLPEFRILLKSVRYKGHFVVLDEYDGNKVIHEKHPYDIPLERRLSILNDDFINTPAGQGWVLDFWGHWESTDYINVPQPTQNEHYLLMSGDNTVFTEHKHHNNQGGAIKDLIGALYYGQTVKITAKVKATLDTNASLQLWCHDMALNPKSRYTEPVVPSTEWQEISMLYTATQTENLRIHLLYNPGFGEIHVDSVTVESLFT